MSTKKAALAQEIDKLVDGYETLKHEHEKLHALQLVCFIAKFNMHFLLQNLTWILYNTFVIYKI